jgi:hypothetical protein
MRIAPLTPTEKHHGEDLSPGEWAGKLARIDDVMAGLTLRTVMMMVFVVVTIIGTPMMVVAVFAVVVIVLGSGAMSYLRCCRTRILQRWKMAMILGGQQPSTNQCDERVAHRFKQVRPGIDLKA